MTGESNLTFDGAQLQLTNNSYASIRTANGSNSVPGFAFTSDSDTGLYLSATGQLAVTTGATQRAIFYTNGLKLNKGLGVGTTPSSTTGEIRATNDVTAFYSADRRLKENIKPIENALDKVSKINGCEFDWKPLTEKEKETIHSHEGHDVGVIAQEIEEVLPEVVETRATGYKAVKYEKIVPLLIESIKDLKAEIEELKGKI